MSLTIFVLNTYKAVFVGPDFESIASNISNLSLLIYSSSHSLRTQIVAFHIEASSRRHCLLGKSAIMQAKEPRRKFMLMSTTVFAKNASSTAKEFVSIIRRIAYYRMCHIFGPQSI
jgi:hypothetical protein